FASVVTRDNSGNFIIDPNALYLAYSLASDNGIDIVNVSLSLPNSTKALKEASTKYGRSVLLVAAAGNDKKNMGDGPIWPAAFGGDPANASGAIVVTVGAHNAVGDITDFSRRGWQYVDLLAPGCGIPTFTGYTNDEEAFSVRPAAESGTSF